MYIVREYAVGASGSGVIGDGMGVMDIEVSSDLADILTGFYFTVDGQQSGEVSDGKMMNWSARGMSSCLDYEIVKANQAGLASSGLAFNNYNIDKAHVPRFICLAF